ncbi:MAG: hypothetical protein GX931_06740 [Acholeplasmataceae bacterium]|nr:hypothetical protein [Acholeplasmataceae bacterium]
MIYKKIDCQSVIKEFNNLSYEKRKLICNLNGIFQNTYNENTNKSDIELLTCKLIGIPFYVYKEEKEVIRSWVQGIDKYKNLIKIDLHDSVKDFMANSYSNSDYTITKIKENERKLYHNQMKTQFNNLDFRLRQLLCNINGIINCSEKDNYPIIDEILDGKFFSINQEKSFFEINAEKLDKDGNMVRLVFNQLINKFFNTYDINSEYKAVIY